MNFSPLSLLGLALVLFSLTVTITGQLTTYPIAVLYEVSDETLSEYPVNVGFLNNSQAVPIVPNMGVPFAGLSSSAYQTAVDSQFQVIYTTVLNALSNSQYALMGLSIQPASYGGNENAPGEIWSVNNLDSTQIDLSRATGWDGPYGMTWVKGGLIYMIWLNTSSSVEDFTYGISTYNVNTGRTNYVTSSPSVPSTAIPDAFASFSSAYNEGTGIYYWQGQGDYSFGGTGQVVAYNIKQNTFPLSYSTTQNDPISQCYVWTFDPFSGSIYATCRTTPTTHILATLNLEEQQVTPVGTLISHQQIVVMPGGFTVDYLTGPAYLCWYNSHQNNYWAAQINLQTGTITTQLALNNTQPLWMAFAHWV